MRKKYFLLSGDFHDIKIPSDMVATPPHKQLTLLITVCTVCILFLSTSASEIPNVIFLSFCFFLPRGPLLSAFHQICCDICICIFLWFYIFCAYLVPLKSLMTNVIFLSDFFDDFYFSFTRAAALSLSQTTMTCLSSKTSSYCFGYLKELYV